MKELKVYRPINEIEDSLAVNYNNTVPVEFDKSNEDFRDEDGDTILDIYSNRGDEMYMRAFELYDYYRWEVVRYKGKTLLVPFKK